MIVLKIIGIAVAVIFLTVAVIPLLPLTVEIKLSAEGEAIFIIRFAGITVFRSDKVKAKPKKTAGGDDKKRKKSKAPLSKRIKKAIATVKSVYGDVKPLLSKIKIVKFGFHAVCASEDAASAALDYGATCAVVYSALGYLKSVSKDIESCADVSVRCDFGLTEPAADFDFAARARAFHIIACAWRVFISQKSKREVK